MASKPKSKKSPKQTDSYEHDSAERANLPSTQTEPLMGREDREPIPFSPEVRERDDEPVLAWQRSSALTQPGGGGLGVAIFSPVTTRIRYTSVKKFGPKPSLVH